MNLKVVFVAALLFSVTFACDKSSEQPRSPSLVGDVVDWEALDQHKIRFEILFDRATPHHGCIVEAYSQQKSVGYIRVSGEAQERRLIEMALDRGTSNEVSSVRVTDCGT